MGQNILVMFSHDYITTLHDYNIRVYSIDFSLKIINLFISNKVTRFGPVLFCYCS